MIRFFAILLASLASLAIASCRHSPPLPAPPDADAGTTSLELCAHLSKLPSGEVCPEATVATCAVAFDRGEQVTLIDRPCLAAARSAADARACGSFVTCPQSASSSQ
jgi:hypothetical protein